LNHNIGLSGFGFYLPEKRVLVSSLAAKSGIPQIVIDYIGSKYVYEAEEEMPSDMSIFASKNALSSSSVKAQDIGVIINAPAGMQDYNLPPISGKIQSALSATNASFFDMYQGCCGMLTAIELAKNYILAGGIDHVLVVSGDRWSSYTNHHTADAVIFGDGAGAVVVSRNSSDFLIKDFLYISKGEYFHLWGIKDSGIQSYYRNANWTSSDKIYKCLDQETAKGDFKKIYAPTFVELAKKILDKNGLSTSDIGFFNMVNANKKLLEIVAGELNIPIEKTSSKYIVEHGHIGGFDIFLNIQEAIKAQQLKKGDIILNLNAGIGFTWGASILIY